MQLCIHGGTIKYRDFDEINSSQGEAQVNDEAKDDS